MTVKELFQIANTKLIADEIAADDWELENDNTKSDEEKSRMRNFMSAKIQEAFDKMLEIVPVADDTKIILCTKVISLGNDDGEYINASMLYKNDVVEKDFLVVDYDDDEREPVSMNEYEEKFIQSYAFEFTKWNEILGWEVAESSIDEYGADAVAKAIFDEMTFFGLYQSAAETRAGEEMDILIERAKEAEENPESGIPFEDLMAELYEDLGIEPPTEDEERERKSRWNEEAKINQEEMLKVAKSLKDALTKEREEENG